MVLGILPFANEINVVLKLPLLIEASLSNDAEALLALCVL